MLNMFINIVNQNSLRKVYRSDSLRRFITGLYFDQISTSTFQQILAHIRVNVNFGRKN